MVKHQFSLLIFFLLNGAAWFLLGILIGIDVQKSKDTK